MSLHSSLKTQGAMDQKRNVLKRFERINKLRSEGKWKAEDKKVFGLPKTKVEE